MQKDKKIVIGILIEFSETVTGSATTILYLEIQDWADEQQPKMDVIQRELGYFRNPAIKSYK